MISGWMIGGLLALAKVVISTLNTITFDILYIKINHFS